MERIIKTENTASDYLDYNEDIVIKEEYLEKEEDCDNYMQESNEDTDCDDSSLAQNGKTEFILKEEIEPQSMQLDAIERSILHEELDPKFILPQIHVDKVSSIRISSSYSNKNEDIVSDYSSSVKTGVIIKEENEPQSMQLGVNERSILLEEVDPESILPQIHVDEVLSIHISSSCTNKNEDIVSYDSSLVQSIKTAAIIKEENEPLSMQLGEVDPESILPQVHVDEVLSKRISSSYTNKKTNKSASSQTGKYIPKVNETSKSESFKTGKKCKKKVKKLLSKKKLSEKASKYFPQEKLVKPSKKSLIGVKESKGTLNIEMLKVKRNSLDLKVAENKVCTKSELTQNIIQDLKIIPKVENSISTISNVLKNPTDNKVYLSMKEIDNYINVVEKLMRNNKSEIFYCSVCSYESSRLQLLKRHMTNHLCQKKFQCQQCDYQSNFRSYLKEHSVTHSNYRAFKCSQCNFASKLKSNIKKHEKTHLKKVYSRKKE